MKLDGYDVEVGDPVWDVCMGPGHVEAIQGDAIVVSFGTHSLSYASTGHGGYRYRTLYWKNPIRTTPAKCDKVFELAGKIEQAVNQVLKSHLKDKA